MSECKAVDCDAQFHWCSSCGFAENVAELARESGYCSAECALVTMPQIIGELEAEVLGLTTLRETEQTLMTAAKQRIEELEAENDKQRREIAELQTFLRGHQHNIGQLLKGREAPTGK